MMEWLSSPWSWYAGGLMVALVMFLLLWVGGDFGVSATMRTICSMGGAGKKIGFFNFDWKSQIWNLVFICGAVIGGYIAHTYLNDNSALAISSATIKDMQKLGISFSGELLPTELFSWKSLLTLKGFIVLIVGGFLVGFGARWAGGCTSGHAISGISNLQWPSLLAVIGFFIGGLAMTHFLFPIIFN